MNVFNIKGVQTNTPIVLAGIRIHNTLVAFVAELSTKEIIEQLASIVPVLSVDAISNLGSLYLTLDQTCIFKFLQMLAYGRLSNWQLLLDVSTIAFCALCKILHDRNSGRMSKCFGKSCQRLCLYTIVFLCHKHLLKFIAKIR